MCFGEREAKKMRWTWPPEEAAFWAFLRPCVAAAAAAAAVLGWDPGGSSTAAAAAGSHYLTEGGVARRRWPGLLGRGGLTPRGGGCPGAAAFSPKVFIS